MNGKKLILTATILLIVGAFVILGTNLFNGSKQEPVVPDINTQQPTPENTEEITPESSSIPPPPQFKDKQVITVTDAGFNPSDVTVSVGTLVQWINQSGGEATVNSDEHPTHQLYPPLNLGLFPVGSSVSLIFDKTGTYRYHDHLHPERTGSITVE